jgi:sugar/nucleoside kinase (ribokinase family)
MDGYVRPDDAERAARVDAMTTAANSPRIVVLGDVMTDIIVRPQAPIAVGSDTPSTIETHAGGAGANLAAWLATTGLDVHFVGCVGSDPFGAAHRAALERVGVTPHLAIDPMRQTGMIVALVDPSGERSMLTQRGANSGLHRGHVPDEIVQAADWLHLSGYSLVADETRPVALAALELARARGVRISVDPASAALLAAVGPQRFIEWTRGVDLCVPNLEEGRLLSGEQDAEEAARVLSEWYGGVVVKLGANGAIWRRAGEQPLRLPGERIEVVDSTGAGDALCAGFLGRWMRGGSAEDALAAGMRLGASAARRMGARPAGADFPV